MADYQVRLINLEKKIDVTITCPEGMSVLEAAESQDIRLPYSCRSGACSTCASRLLQGTLDQTGQVALQEDEVTNGYVLACIGFPTSNCTLLTHQGPRGRATMPKRKTGTRPSFWPW